jgi:hypothetical protein
MASNIPFHQNECMLDLKVASNLDEQYNTHIANLLTRMRP